MYRRLTIALALAALVSTGAATAVSAQDDAAPQAHIKTDDLDLHSAAGKATFDSRVRGAAESVCGSDSSGVSDLATKSAARDCHDRVMRSGDAQATALLARQDAAGRSIQMARDGHAIPYRSLRRTAHRHAARRVVHHRHGHAHRRLHTPR